MEVVYPVFQTYLSPVTNSGHIIRLAPLKDGWLWSFRPHPDEVTVTGTASTQYLALRLAKGSLDDCLRKLKDTA